MLNLASAASMDLSSAADIVTDTMSAFGMEATEAERAADIFAKTMSSSNTDVTQLGEAMKYVGAAANSAGMDLEQTNAILGKLADAGLKGSTGGTVLAGMLREVQAKAEDGAIAIGRTSVAVYDAEGNMRDMISILEDVEKATKGMSDEQRNAALSAIWGAEAMRGVNIIMESGTDSVRDLEKALRNSKGASEEMKNTMEGGIGGAFRSLKSATEGLAIAFGEVLAPYIQSLAEKITSLVQWFTGLSDGMKKTILLIAGVVAAIGPLLLIFGHLIIFVSNVTGVISKLGPVLNVIRTVFIALTGPIGIIIAIVTVLSIVIYKNWEDIKTWTIETWGQIKEFLSAFWQATKIVFELTVEYLSNLISGTWNFITTKTKETYQGIKTFLSETWQGVKNVFLSTVQAVATFISEKWQFIKTKTYEIYNSLKSKIVEIWNYIKTFTTEKVEAIRSTVAEKFQALREAVREKLVAMKEKIIGIWNEAQSFLEGIDLFSIGSDIIQGLIDGIVSKVGAVASAIKDVTSAITGKIKSILDIHSPSRVMMELGGYTTEGLEEGILARSKNLEKAAEKIGNVAISGVESGTISRASGSSGGFNYTDYSNYNVVLEYKGGTGRTRQELLEMVDMIDRELERRKRINARAKGVILT
jgi:TP901 family phage tail tape measure protein